MRFTIATILCMTSLVLASPAPLCAAQVADDGLEVLDGKCSYPPRLGKPGPEDRRLECDTVVLLPSGQDSVLVQFAKKGSGAPVGFAGPIGDNGEMSVRRVYLSPGNPTAATAGHCRLFEQDGKTTGIWCVASIGRVRIIANFRVAPKITPELTR
ncbi:hypothetical protein J2X47_004060 [Sphingomonas sp. BE270]|jgi:hypothetical protein|uniref:hypothetical protein n=1 Tax=unclassified Sphingomonas TaxID=196159 RepID=UPI00053D9423|nr:MULTISPECIES: hypothetical protein [unclassified Sphingomonas]MDR7259854.1 hypothetical protein [Sphingomonas sp. BE270]